MERSLGFRMGFFSDDDDEWGVVVVKDLEMGIVGNRKTRRVGVVLVVVVLSSILRVLSFFLPQVTTNDERPLPACLPLD